MFKPCWPPTRGQPYLSPKDSLAAAPDSIHIYCILIYIIYNIYIYSMHCQDLHFFASSDQFVFST